MKKLIKEPKARKRLVEKYIRSTLYFALFGALPGMFLCQFSKFLPFNRVTTLLCYLLGGIIGFAVEKPMRHAQLLTFMLPKAIDCLANLLE